MKLVGEHKNVWNGAMKNIVWPEGPHLYKKGEYYLSCTQKAVQDLIMR